MYRFVRKCHVFQAAWSASASAACPASRRRSETLQNAHFFKLRRREKASQLHAGSTGAPTFRPLTLRCFCCSLPRLIEQICNEAHATLMKPAVTRAKAYLKARHKTVRDALKALKLDALLLTHPPDLAYLTNFTGHDSIGL